MDGLVGLKVVYTWDREKSGDIWVRDGKAETKRRDGRGGLQCPRLTIFIFSLFAFSFYLHPLVNGGARKYSLYLEFLIMFCIGTKRWVAEQYCTVLRGSVLLLAYYTVEN